MGSPHTPGAPRPLTLGQRNLVLVGMRSAGKTTLGRRLAERLGRPFVDLDLVLAERAGRPADEVLAREGEARFRQLERQVLHAEAASRGRVIATGGGAVLHAEAFAELAEHSLVVYLDTDVATLIDRAALRPQPPLTGLPPSEEIAAVLAHRDPLYRQAAQIVVETRSGDPILTILTALGLS